MNDNINKGGRVMLYKRLLFFVTVFVSCLLISNIVASKLVMLWGLVIPAAVFVFPLTFLMTDVVNEVWGKAPARFMVLLGFGASLLLVGYLTLAQYLPAAPFWDGQQAYEMILGAVPRIVLASMVAYLVSQFHDVWAFNFWKEKTHGKYLWLRNNLSTMSSQLIDTAIFIVIAFWGIVPNDILIVMVLSQYVIKLTIAVIDTPICYILVKWVRG